MLIAFLNSFRIFIISFLKLVSIQLKSLFHSLFFQEKSLSLLTESSSSASFYLHLSLWASVHFSSVAQYCPTLCDPMNRSTPGLPVHHHLPEFTQTHVHQVGDAIQPSHPTSSPFPPAPNPSQHLSLFQWVNSFTWGSQSTRVSALPSFLPKNTQGWSPLE